MSSNDIPIGEAYILDFISRNEEPSSQPAHKAPNSRPQSPPRLRRSGRKLSEPLHKTTAPGKPILKSSLSATHTSSDPFIKKIHPLSSALKNNVPLSINLAYSRSMNASTTALTSGSDDDLFWTPGSLSTIDENDTNDTTSNSKRDDYWGNWEKKELPTLPSEDQSSRSFSEASTPLPSPKLRTSFLEELPYPGYPIVPRNTIRHRALPIVDELDRNKNTIPFPSRASFDFSAPGMPSSSEFTSSHSTSAKPYIRRRTSSIPTATAESVSGQRLSLKPFLPSYTQRSHSLREFLRHESIELASKRKSTHVGTGVDSVLEPKRRKLVQFALPAGHEKHPLMKRRPTPYHSESFSVKVKKILFSLFAPSVNPKESNEKRMKKGRKVKEGK